MPLYDARLDAIASGILAYGCRAAKLSMDTRYTECSNGLGDRNDFSELHDCMVDRISRGDLPRDAVVAWLGDRVGGLVVAGVF